MQAQSQYKSMEECIAGPNCFGCPCSEAGGRTWLSFSRMAEKRGVRVPETTRSGSLYPHLARTWSASACTSATSCSACAFTRTQAQHGNKSSKALLQVT